MGTVKEIDLKLKKGAGAISDVSDLLGANSVHIIAFCTGTEKDKTKLRFVANDPEKAVNVLKTAGYNIAVKDVMACEIPRHAGGLNAVLKSLKVAGIPVDYAYPCIGTGEISALILGVGSMDKALKAMADNWIRVLGEELYHLQ
ncbi:MAG: hypothetical protein JRJ85_23450 [Deltaproteobacteria bacterium]|nr:hypothetical protein [Deltaproteobacteria bacterium]